MTEDEHKALEWLDHMTTQAPTDYARERAAILKCMLARPTLPEDNTPELEKLRHALCDHWPDHRQCSTGAMAHSVLCTIRAHLARPPKAQWGVNMGLGWVHFDTFAEAASAAEVEAKSGRVVGIQRVARSV